MQNRVKVKFDTRKQENIGTYWLFIHLSVAFDLF